MYVVLADVKMSVCALSVPQAGPEDIGTKKENVEICRTGYSVCFLGSQEGRPKAGKPCPCLPSTHLNLGGVRLPQAKWAAFVTFWFLLALRH